MKRKQEQDDKKPLKKEKISNNTIIASENDSGDSPNSNEESSNSRGKKEIHIIDKYFKSQFEYDKAEKINITLNGFETADYPLTKLVNFVNSIESYRYDPFNRAAKRYFSPQVIEVLKNFMNKKKAETIKQFDLIFDALINNNVKELEQLIALVPKEDFKLLKERLYKDGSTDKISSTIKPETLSFLIKKDLNSSSLIQKLMGQATFKDFIETHAKTIFFQSCSENEINVEFLQQFIDGKYVDINHIFLLNGKVSFIAKPQSKSPLAIALSSENLTLLNLFIMNGADFDKEIHSVKIKTILKTLLKKHKATDEIIKFIIDHSSLESKDILLTLATEVGAKDIIAKLTSQGADINLLNRDGKTPLMLALESQKLETFKDLLNKGANPETLFIDPNSSNNNGKTILIMAAEKGEYKFIFELMRKGVMLNDQVKNIIHSLDPECGLKTLEAFEIALKQNPHIFYENFIEFAVKEGYLEAVKRAFDKITKDNCNEYIYIAAESEKSDIAKYFIDQYLKIIKARPTQKGVEFYKIFACVMKLGDIEMAKAMLELNFDVRTPAPYGGEKWRLSIWALKFKQPEILNLMLKEEYDKSWGDHNTLLTKMLTLSGMYGNAAVAEVVLKHIEERELEEEKENSIDNSLKGKITPLMVAAYCCNLDVVKLLISKGANLLNTDAARNNFLTYCTGLVNFDYINSLFQGGNYNQHAGTKPSIQKKTLEEYNYFVKELLSTHIIPLELFNCVNPLAPNKKVSIAQDKDITEILVKAGYKEIAETLNVYKYFKKAIEENNGAHHLLSINRSAENLEFLKKLIVTHFELSAIKLTSKEIENYFRKITLSESSANSAQENESIKALKIKIQEVHDHFQAKADEIHNDIVEIERMLISNFYSEDSKVFELMEYNYRLVKQAILKSEYKDKDSLEFMHKHGTFVMEGKVLPQYDLGVNILNLLGYKEDTIHPGNSLGEVFGDGVILGKFLQLLAEFVRNDEHHEIISEYITGDFLNNFKILFNKIKQSISPDQVQVFEEFEDAIAIGEAEPMEVEPVSIPQLQIKLEPISEDTAEQNEMLNNIQDISDELPDLITPMGDIQ
jgi:ankyrin repeat protein